MAKGIIQYTKDIINDSIIGTKTTYSSKKIEELLNGDKFIKTDNCECYVPDSTEYVDDEFECFIMGYGYYLVFLNDHDEGSDSLGKFLVNRYNVKSKNLEGIRGMLSGLVLTCS